MDEKKSLVPAGRADIIPDTQNMVTLAKYLYESKMFPNIGSVAGIITTMEYGRELGIPPVAALSTMQCIRGRLTMEAKAMLAVAQKNSGVSWKIDKLDNEECVMIFMREGFSPCRVTFTAQEAKDAGLLTKDSWKMYRQDMLFARCASRGVRRIAPDAVLGLYSSEEMRDVESTAKKDMEEGARPAPSEGEVKDAEVVDGEAEQDVPVDDAGDEAAEEPFVGDDDGADTPGDDKREPVPDKPAPPPDAIRETYVKQIKRFIEEEKLDPQDFKKFLVAQGTKMNRKFVGQVGRNLSITAGDIEDLRHLVGVMPKAIALYRKEKEGLA
jgi:hypothetical protein